MGTLTTARSETAGIIYVTSFSPDLYEASGKFLLQSRVDAGVVDPILICHEGGIDISVFPGANVHTYDLATSDILKNWLAANLDIIPVHLGGQAKECSCPNHEQRHAKHAPRCHYQWMNRNASRWFRKVVAWHQAVTIIMPDLGRRYMVWLDSDCLFRKVLAADTLQAWMRKKGVLYMLGKRMTPETGVLALDCSRGGIEFVEQVLGSYMSGRFRAEARWDDTAISLSILRNPQISSIDIVDPSLPKTNQVLPTTPLGEFFEHRKGLHGRVLGVMR